MKRITDKKRTDHEIEQLSLQKKFDTGSYQFFVHEYEKEEFLITPYITESPNILFLLEGEVKLYYLQEDGTMGTVGIAHAGDVLGDFEFCRREPAPLFAEAVSRVSCLALPWQQYENQLRRDADFLLFLLNVAIDKMGNAAELSDADSSLEERLLFYIQNMCADRMIKNVNSTFQALHCSRRQLQRLLKKLCDDKVLEKTGRGHYRILT